MKKVLNCYISIICPICQYMRDRLLKVVDNVMDRSCEELESLKESKN